MHGNFTKVEIHFKINKICNKLFYIYEDQSKRYIYLYNNLIVYFIFIFFCKEEADKVVDYLRMKNIKRIFIHVCIKDRQIENIMVL